MTSAEEKLKNFGNLPAKLANSQILSYSWKQKEEGDTHGVVTKSDQAGTFFVLEDLLVKYAAAAKPNKVGNQNENSR